MSTLVQILLSGVAIGSLYALIALGYSLTYVVNGTLNMSQGQLVMLGGMLMYSFTVKSGIPFIPALLLTGIIVGVLGIVMERLAVRKFATDPSSVGWVLSTIAAGIIIQDVAQFLWGPDERVVPSPAGEEIVRLFGAGVYWKELIFIPVAALFFAGLAYFYKYSHWGLWLRATADNRTAVELVGINSHRVVATAYMLCGILGGLGGAMMATNFAVSASIGLSLGLKAISVAILAGLNSAKGIVISGLALGLAEVAVAQFISSDFREIIIYLFVILVLYVKPTGWFGTKPVVKV
ncbi:branched-chain amino acid ABC transporter permease [Paenibacillus sp. H1-7]|uniref:branched-chain amino acid ABC transporter permease n=1 Tax=Paenibacillus sp. H1-7 TaxID=2282849 RepID=UPI001EF8B961|nr:branched-chain amino acid ABC transporter permease [Paenibacillus sp. H1-7]ULL18468.1 branched-chain amino acid ABC transporter permease [Paenibacillus sp. H1-7]